MDSLIIIGGGNSIRSFPTLWDDIVNQDVMTINNAYRFVNHIPKYQISIDRKFWKDNESAMDKLQAAGCQLINRNREYITCKTFYADGNLYCGQRKLSGIFALSYATRKMNYDSIYLFGYDFGVIEGRTHFYDGVNHSGINKTRAYYDGSGDVLDAMNDFDHFVDHNIMIVGESNIKTFPKISYNQFEVELKNDRD